MTPATWDDVKPGDTITVKRMYRKRSFKIQVRKVDTVLEANPWRFVVGNRLRMDDTRSRRRTQRGLREGERLEFVHINDIITIERGEQS